MAGWWRPGKPLGLTEVHFTEEKQPETDSPFALDLEGRCLDTPFYSIKWDESGAFTSLWDKENGRQVLKGRGNVLRIYEDKPMNYDAWDIDIFYGQKFEDIPACEIRCTEDGPLQHENQFCLPLPRFIDRAGSLWYIPATDGLILQPKPTGMRITGC